MYAQTKEQTPMKTYNLLGPVVRKVDKAMLRIVIFSTVVKIIEQQMSNS